MNNEPITGGDENIVHEVRKRLNATVASVASHQEESAVKRLWTLTEIANAQADARDFEGALATLEPLRESLWGDLPGTAVQHLANRMIDAGQFERAFSFADTLQFTRPEVYAYGAKRYAQEKRYAEIFALLPRQQTSWSTVLKQAIPECGSDAPYPDFVQFVEDWRYPTGIDLGNFVQYGDAITIQLKTEILCLIARQQAKFGDRGGAEAALRIALHIIDECPPNEVGFDFDDNKHRLSLLGNIIATALAIGLPETVPPTATGS